MGQIIKANNELPYKSLIFNYKNTDLVDILFDNTNKNWQILSSSTGFITILDTAGIDIEQDKYCVIVTPIRQSNNHSICVQKDFSINNIITLVCCENGNNTLTDDGFDNMTVQINFFNL